MHNRGCAAIRDKGKRVSSVAVSVLIGSQRPPELGGRLTPRTGGWRGNNTIGREGLQRGVGLSFYARRI